MWHLGKWHIHKDKWGVTTKTDQEHHQVKPRRVKVNPIHTNHTLNIKSKPKTTKLELESPEALIGWVLIEDKKFLNTVLWDELKNQEKKNMIEERPCKNLSERYRRFEDVTRNTMTILGGRIIGLILGVERSQKLFRNKFRKRAERQKSLKFIMNR